MGGANAEGGGAASVCGSLVSSSRSPSPCVHVGGTVCGEVGSAHLLSAEVNANITCSAETDLPLFTRTFKF